MSKPSLTYFNGRGLAEISRLILAEANVDYDDVRIQDIAPLKPNLPFGQVPIWKDGNGFELAQSSAIARYLARTYGFYGKNPKEDALIDSILAGFDDLLSKIRPVIRMPDGNEKTVELEKLNKEIIPLWLSFIEKLIKAHGSNGHAVGDSLTLADIAIFHYISNYASHKVIQLDASAFPAINAVVAAVGKRERIAAWVQKRPVTEF